MEKKEGTKKCLFCSNKISLATDNFVLVGTYNRSKSSDDEQYFHFPCFQEYFNKCVLNKAKANVKMMQEKVMGLFDNPVMKSMLSQISGSEQILAMFQTPLTVEALPSNVDSQKVQEIKSIIKNGRRKKRSGKKKETSLH